MSKYCLFIISLLAFGTSKAQDSEGKVKLPAEYLFQLSARAAGLESVLDKKTDKALLRLSRQEEKIRRKLSRLDSSKASEVFGDAKGKYEALKGKLHSTGKLTQYISYLDTLKTSLKFLQNNQQLLSKGKDYEKQISAAAGKLKGLESSLQKGEEVKAFIRERKQYFKDQLQHLPFTKELKRINKRAYYYSAQVSEYKEVLKDARKRERKAIELLSKTKPFQDFMRRNSELASLFRLPGSDEPLSAASLQGLQTRASVNALIQDRIGSSAGAQALFRQNVQGAQAQLSQLKDKVSQYSSGSFGNSSSEIDMPEGFKPNTQKTKSFFKRLEWGGNVQSQRARQYFPVTSDIALSLGYRLSDKGSMGIGASYKLGLGKGWNSIALSHQGIGLRSHLDYKLKGSLYISGGYEQNYRTLFRSIEQLRDRSAWQSSGLIGLSKKYSVSRKMKGSVQLLWDLLSYQQVPKTQAVLFRVGYSLK